MISRALADHECISWNYSVLTEFVVNVSERPYWGRRHRRERGVAAGEGAGRDG
jgi:hypothetical protein